MERHTIAEMKEILDAMEQGKLIQWYHQDANTWRDFDSNHGNPNFNFIHRIKPEEPKKHYRPFKDIDEFIKAAGGLGAIWIKNKTRNKMQSVICVDYNDKNLPIRLGSSSWEGFGSLLEFYTFADGTPCGVEEDA